MSGLTADDGLIPDVGVGAENEEEKEKDEEEPSQHPHGEEALEEPQQQDQQQDQQLIQEDQSEGQPKQQQPDEEQSPHQPDGAPAPSGEASTGSALDHLGPEGYGDVTRDIFFALRDGPPVEVRRTSSWHGQETEEPTRSSVAVPGGFRRHFVLTSSGEAAAQREADPSRSPPAAEQSEKQGAVPGGEGETEPRTTADAAAAAAATTTKAAATGPASQTLHSLTQAPPESTPSQRGASDLPSEPGGPTAATLRPSKPASEAGSEEGTPQVGQLLRGGLGGPAPSPSSSPPSGAGLGLPQVANYGAVLAVGSAVGEAPPRPGQQVSGTAYAGSTTFVGELSRLHSANEEGNEEDSFDVGGFGLDARLLPLRAFGLCPRRGGAGRGDLYTEPWQVVLVIVKSFTGSAVLYLPHALAVGGLGLAGGSLLLIGAIVILCVRKLVDCAETVVLSRASDTYAELAEASLGPLGRLAVEVSLLTSQLGFAATYLVTIAANAREVVEVLSDCHLLLAPHALLPLVTLLLAPLAFVRDLRSYDWMNIFSSLALAVALICIAGVAAWKHTTHPSKEPVLWANSQAISLSLGTAVYAFEGIGMVLPAYVSTSPKLRPQFKDLVTKTLSVLLGLLILFATSCYLAFGSRTQTIVLLALQSGSALKSGVQLLYSLALAFTFPLALWPAFKILEARTAGVGNKMRTSWQRHSLLRCFAVLLTALLASPGPGRLGEFVALVGALACAPLAITFPAWIHLALLGRSGALDDRTDRCLILVGVLLTIVCLVSAALHWNEELEVLPRFCTVAAREWYASKGSAGDLFLFRSPLLLR